MFTLYICFILTELVSLNLCQFCTPEGNCRQLEFHPSHTFHGKRLKNHVIHIVSVTVGDFCETACYMEPNCVSYNLKKKTIGSVEYQCELNNSTFEERKSELEENPYYIYRGAKNACLKESCSNNATCQTGYTDKGYRCLCTAGFKGPRCKTDIDECAAGTHNCSADALCNNTKGSYNCYAVSSCKEIYEKNLSRECKAYPLTIGKEVISVYCHMIMTNETSECGNGGWTLIMKINGTKSTFHYDSSLWSNNKTFNLVGGETGLNTQETKLPTYWNTSFSKICLGMKIGEHINFIVINKQASSLYSLIADGQHRATSLELDTWKRLIGNEASLQDYCKKQGFNSKSERVWHSKARIGILGNNENNCDSCDSRIGFGTGGEHDDNNTCGNEAQYGGDNGNKHIKGMGFIFVQ